MIQTILKHRSIRKYLDKEIPDNIFNEIMEATSRASTTGNMQVYSIIVTRDKKVKEKLWEAHFRQNMVKQAPVVLTFCADFNRFNKWCSYRNAAPGYNNFLSFFTGAIDALLAAQNCCVAAESHGLGICYLGTTTYNADKIIDILNLPDSVVPVTTIVAGYPDETPELTDRLPLDAIIHYDKYNNYDRYSIDRLYAEKERLPLTAKLLEENQLDTLAQIFTEKRYTKKDNIVFSKKYLEVLKKQGFMDNEL
ncbi:MAG TPA: NADPH-dependent oxidoreductase [Bacteroidales bacterium]|jgi:nitroreductase|nr:NADPH-dependent oxidoreductase [Bacteroidales bacterium]